MVKSNKYLGLAAAQILAAFAGLLTTIVVSWIMSSSDIGRINTFQVVLSFFLLISLFGLDQAYVRDYFATTEKHNLLKLCFLPGFILTCIAAILITYSNSETLPILFNLQGTNFYPLLFCCTALNYIFTFQMLVIRMSDNVKWFFLGQVLPKILQLFSLLGIHYILLEKVDFTSYLRIITTSYFFIVILFFWVLRRDIIAAYKARINYRVLLKLLRYGLPLVFSGVAYWGLVSTGTFALRYLSNDSQLGIYAVAISFGSIAAIFQGVFSLIWAPFVYKKVELNEALDIGMISEQVVAIASLLMASVITFSWLIVLILPSSFYDVKYLIIGSILPSILYTIAEVSGIGISVSKKTHFSTIAVVLSWSIAILLCLILVPVLGAVGAVLSNCIAFYFYFLIKTELSVWTWKKIPRLKLHLSVGLYVSLVCIILLFGPSLAHTLPLLGIFVGVVCGVAFRRNFMQLARQLFHA